MKLDQQLDNWRKHYCDKYHQRVTQSLEGRFKPEAGDVLETDLQPPSAPIDVKLALGIEKIVISLPMPHKICLVAQYMYPNALRNANFFKFCRVAAIKPRDFDDILKKSKLMIENKLNRLDNNILQA